jgi:hypothetical protein
VIASGHFNKYATTPYRTCKSAYNFVTAPQTILLFLFPANFNNIPYTRPEKELLFLPDIILSKLDSCCKLARATTNKLFLK